MRRRLFLCILLLPMLLMPSLPAQTASPWGDPALPIVTYEVFWEAATPQAYTITVQPTGKARYTSRNPTKPPDSNGPQDEDYELEFNVSQAGSEKIFALSRQAGYFNGDFDYKKHAVASTGKKTLSYADIDRRFHTTYNWSENPAIDQLTRLFGGISNTIEHGRRLQFLRRFDKLGLEAELKGMEEMAQNQNLSEIQVIAPLLQNIANDSSVLNIARQRARRLLANASK